MAEILIVDDERVIREGMKVSLAGEGYAVRTARDGKEALVKIAKRRPDLVLLDVMMPKMNGFRCCEEIRKADPLLPVVFLTAKDSEADQVRAIGLGGDSFVSKSAGDALLLTCIRRALERTERLSGSPASVPPREIRLGDVIVDTKRLTVREGDAEIARLTKTEADILVCLYAHRGDLVTFDDLITELRGNGFACEDSMLYAHMSHLRTKLGKQDRQIVSTRGVGYSLV